MFPLIDVGDIPEQVWSYLICTDHVRWSTSRTSAPLQSDTHTVVDGSGDIDGVGRQYQPNVHS
jgi:hypothetical protein